MEDCEGHLCPVCGNRWRYIGPIGTCSREPRECRLHIDSSGVLAIVAERQDTIGWEYEDDFADYVRQVREVNNIGG